MTAITSGTATTESQRAVDANGSWSPSDIAVAVALSVVVAAAAWATFSRLQLLAGWNQTFSSVGQFTVVGCEPEDRFGPDRWDCAGRLARSPSSSTREATLVVSKDGRVASRPYVGKTLAVYYSPSSGEESPVVYSRDGQLAELTRLYLALLPRILVLVGAFGWLLGLLLDRLAARTASQSTWRRSPLISGLQRRGAAWVMAGGGAFVLYYLVVRYVLGSAGVG